MTIPLHAALASSPQHALVFTIAVALVGVVIGALPVSAIYKHVGSEMLTEAQPTNATESGFVILHNAAACVSPWPKSEEDGARRTPGMADPVAVAVWTGLANVLAVTGFPWIPILAVSTRLNGWAATRGSVLLVWMLCWLTHAVCMMIHHISDASGMYGPLGRLAQMATYYSAVLFGINFTFTWPVTGPLKKNSMFGVALLVIAVR